MVKVEYEDELLKIIRDDWVMGIITISDDFISLHVESIIHCKKGFEAYGYSSSHHSSLDLAIDDEIDSESWNTIIQRLKNKGFTITKETTEAQAEVHAEKRLKRWDGSEYCVELELLFRKGLK